MNNHNCPEYMKLTANGGSPMITVQRNGKVLRWYNSDPYTIQTLDIHTYPEYKMERFKFCPYCGVKISNYK